VKQVDFFAAYVIPEDVWYLIPAAVLLRGTQKKALTLLPAKPKHPERYKCECYREAWVLLLPEEEKRKRAKRAISASQRTQDDSQTTPLSSSCPSKKRRDKDGGPAS
jgi:hypothetical protein